MFRSSSCRFKFAKLSAVISFLLTSNLYAATIGYTHIDSIQNQPLAATIEVNDIDADNFSVALANRQVYEQMGLNPRPTMSVSFAKTSATSGKIIINTRAALTEPFADVVLSINNAGTQTVVPKTLLLPLGGANQPKTMTNKPNSQTTGNTKQPNLPVVGQSSDITLGQPMLGEPLPVKNSLPPPLRISSVTPQATVTTEVGSVPLTTKSDTTDNTDSGSNTSGSSQKTTPEKKNSKNYSMNLQSSQTTKATEKSTTTVHKTPAHKPSPKKAKETNTQAKQQVTKKQAAPTPSIALGDRTYTVQRNDNLWTIASQIAAENNLSIQTVMQQIKAYNQEAFIHGDMSLLRADAELKLPAYEVIPSKLGIRAAIEARNAQKNEKSNASSTSASSPDHASKAQSVQSKKSDNSKAESSASNKTITQPLPRPQVTLVTPSSSGNATGGQTSQSATGTGLNSELLSELKSTRQLTANKAQRVQSLSKQLAESTNRMQIQNQRLADLEQRLKDLRNK